MGQMIERATGQHLMVGTTAVVTVLRVDPATVTIQITHGLNDKHVHTLSINESRMIGPRTGVTFKRATERAAILYVTAPPDVAIVASERAGAPKTIDPDTQQPTTGKSK